MSAYVREYCSVSYSPASSVCAKLDHFLIAVVQQLGSLAARPVLVVPGIASQGATRASVVTAVVVVVVASRSGT